MRSKRKKEKKPKAVDPDRALAASEVLQAVFLHEKNFDLESKISDPPIAEEDAEGQLWVTVKLHVPRLDVDMWLDGTHTDHPDNQNDDGDDDGDFE